MAEETKKRGGYVTRTKLIERALENLLRFVTARLKKDGVTDPDQIAEVYQAKAALAGVKKQGRRQEVITLLSQLKEEIVDPGKYESGDLLSRVDAVMKRLSAIPNPVRAKKPTAPAEGVSSQ